MAKSSERKKKYYKQWIKNHPEKVKQYTRTHYIKHKEKLLARAKEWCKNNPQWMKKFTRKMWLKHKYGITESQYRDMLEAQRYKCAICSRVHIETQYQKLHVDHNHKTKKVRELLCRRCNLMIGHANELPNVLRKAARYVEKHNA